MRAYPVPVRRAARIDSGSDARASNALRVPHSRQAHSRYFWGARLSAPGRMYVCVDNTVSILHPVGFYVSQSTLTRRTPTSPHLSMVFACVSTVLHLIRQADFHVSTILSLRARHNNVTTLPPHPSKWCPQPTRTRMRLAIKHAAWLPCRRKPYDKTLDGACAPASELINSEYVAAAAAGSRDGTGVDGKCNRQDSGVHYCHIVFHVRISFI